MSAGGRFSHVEIVMKQSPILRKRAAEGDELEVMSVEAFSKTCDPIWTSPHKRVKKDARDETRSPSSDKTRSSSGNDEPGNNGVGKGPEDEQGFDRTRPQVASLIKNLKRKPKSKTKLHAKTVSFDNDVEMQDAPIVGEIPRSRTVSLTIKPPSREHPILINPHAWPPSPAILPLKEGGHSHPRLARTDVEFEEMLEDLQNMIWTWSKTNFTSSAANLPDLNIEKLARQQLQVVQYLNHVITSSSDFELTIKHHLPIIVYGIVAKSLEVHVFGHEMFGATEAQLDILRKIDIELAHEDSFVRHHTRATTLRSFLGTERTPPRYNEHVDALTLDLHTLLRPLITFTRSDLPSSDPINQRNFPTTIYHIVERAAYLSLSLRREPDTVYLFLSLSKEGSELDIMLGDSPLQLPTDSAKIPVETDNLQIKEAGPYHGKPILEPSQPVVPKFLLWPEVQAYRPNSQRRRGYEKAAGLRSRTVCRAQIALGRLETLDEPKLSEIIGVKAVRERAYKGVVTTIAVAVFMSLWRNGKLPVYAAYVRKAGSFGVGTALEGAELLGEVGRTLGRSIVGRRGYWPLGTEAWNRGFNRTGYYSPGWMKWQGLEGGDYIPNLY